jgi:CDP-diacylglycerol--serine O-phosphatidyltransferase
MNLKALFPCSFTVGNLVCGFLAITLAIEGKTSAAAWLIALGAIMDGLDGSVARAIHSDTQFGREFDSFADFVTFGVAPMAMLYSAFSETLGGWTWVLSGLFLVAGAYRLIRHNLTYEHVGHQRYMGLPITSCGILLAGFVLLTYHYYGGVAMHGLLVSIVLVLMVLMVSTINFPRFRLFKKSSPFWLKFLLSILFALPLIIKPQVMIFVMILAYIIIVLMLEVSGLFIRLISKMRTGRM